MSTYSVQALQEKLSRLSLSQDSIETLSLWIIHHKVHAKTSIHTWLEELKQASADRRLVLFYLANDILQNGRRRGAEIFLESFQDPLREAVVMIGGQKIQTSIERMFRIWKERRIYSNMFLKELEMLIEPVRNPEVVADNAVPDFNVHMLEDALSEFAKFEAELKVKSSHLSNLRVDISNPTTSLAMLKDKSAGGRVSSEFEEAAQKLQDFCECLGIEVNERINILDMLKECSIFTTYRLDELRKTAAGYRTLSLSVKELKKKLEQRLKDLERAHSTSTSDPSAKDDITDVGDMEIESDGEGDTQEGVAKSEAPSLRDAPGMITAPPPPHQINLERSAGYMSVPQHQGRPVLPRGRAPFQRPPSRPAQPYYNQRPMLSQQRPSRPPHITASLGPRPFLRGPARMPVGRTGNPPGGIAASPAVITGSPLIYSSPAPPVPPGQASTSRPVGPPGQASTSRPVGPPGQASTSRPVGPPGQASTSRPVGPPGQASTRPPAPGQSTPPGQASTTHPGLPSGDAKLSLDQRLKHLVANKRFDNTVLGSGGERPYSTAEEEGGLMISNEEEEDKESLPTPTPSSSSDSPNEPALNTDNPILQALYNSQASPSDTNSKPQLPGSEVDTEEDDELTTKDLKNILNQINSQEKNETPPSSGSVVPRTTPLTGCVVPALPVGDKPPVPCPLPKEIKITPTLTNLLDEIFPQLSKSLISDKKRRKSEPVEANKVPRLTEMPRPRFPPQNHQRPSFLPRSPGAPPPRPPHGLGGPPPRPIHGPGGPPCPPHGPGGLPLRPPHGPGGPPLRPIHGPGGPPRPPHRPGGLPLRPPHGPGGPPFEEIRPRGIQELNQTGEFPPSYMYNHGPKPQTVMSADHRFGRGGGGMRDNFPVGSGTPRYPEQPGLYRSPPSMYRPRYVSN